MNTYPQRSKSVETRFLEKVNKFGPPHPYDQSKGRCWIWIGTKAGPNGYGYIWDRDNIRAHRWAFEKWVAPIPEGLRCLHTCDNTMCVNPGHLYLGTDKDNTRDKVSRGRAYGGDKHWSRKKPELLKRGERHFNSKLTEAHVKHIRMLYSIGTPQVAIAYRFGVTIQAINQIVHRKLWKHI